MPFTDNGTTRAEVMNRSVGLAYIVYKLNAVYYMLCSI